MKKRFTLKFIVCFALCLLTIMIASCSNGTHPIGNGHKHEWSEWIVIREATCISEGRAEQKCLCGAKGIKPLKITAHTGGSWVTDKEATLSESGLKHQVCSFCNAILAHKTIPILSEEFLPKIVDEHQEELRPYYQLANCRNLKGNPVVVLIYIDDDNSKWTEEEVLAFTNEQIYVSLDFLEKSAKEWNVDLDFTVEIYSTQLNGYEIKYEGIVNPDLDKGGSTKDVLDKAAEDIGYKSNWGLYTYYKSKYPDNDIIFLNLLNKPGRSYARRFISTGNMPFSEHCVIFADYLNRSPFTRSYGSRSSTVANMILRLFGADDLYTTPERERIAELKYPNDIMLWQYDDITGNSIGDFTAFAVGWTDDVPDVCLDPRWW